MSSDLTTRSTAQQAAVVSIQASMQQQHPDDGGHEQQQPPQQPPTFAAVAAAAAAATTADIAVPTLGSNPIVKNEQGGGNTSISSSSSSSHTSTKKQESLGLITFEQVLSLIPNADKRAYLHAQQTCPELVATESPPRHFLIRDDYNVWAAARRFVAYWEARREIFGDTRAYLPILCHTNRTSGDEAAAAGKGAAAESASALDADDWAALATGWYALLPRIQNQNGTNSNNNNNSNSAGHAVLCVDMSRAKNLTFGPMARSAFYIRSIMAQIELSQSEGYIGVTVNSNEVFRALVKTEYQRLARLLFDVFPVKTKVSFMVTVAQWQFFQLVWPIVERVYNTSSSSSTSKNDSARLAAAAKPPAMLVPLIANSHAEILRKLEPHHLTKEHLPPSLGGTWSYDIFNHWVMATAAAQQAAAATGGGTLAAPTSTTTAPLTKEQTADLESFRQSYSSTNNSDGAGRADNGSSCMGHSKEHHSSSSSCSSLDDMVRTNTTTAGGAAASSLDSSSYSCSQSSSSSSSEHLLLSDFYEALDLIPFEQKRGYVRAMQQHNKNKSKNNHRGVAFLVQEESDPRLFLRCEQNNPQAAARRFVNYWNLRLSIFGPKHAYLPLVSSAVVVGGSAAAALTPDQVAEFNSGAFLILPKDKHGRVVHMFDRSKLLVNAAGGGGKTSCTTSLEEIRKAKLACWFYYISIACRQMSMTTTTPPTSSSSSSSSSTGSGSSSSNYAMHMVCLMVVGPEFFDKPLLASMATEIKNMTATALPVRHVDIHIVCRSPSSSCTRIVSEDKLAFMVDRIGRNTNVHIASCPQEMRNKLQDEIGMLPEGIPVDFGGTWTIEKEGMAERQERFRAENQRLQQFRAAAVELPMPLLPSSSSPSSLVTMPMSAKHPRRRHAVDCDTGGGDSSSYSENRSQKEQSQQQQQQQNKRRKTSLDEINMLQDAIDAMPMDQKKDYLFASKTTPRLVQTESNPELFLSFEPGRDCIAAARRITTYWKRRREIFGQDRAFSPIHLESRTGGGGGNDVAIMSPADSAALRQGFVACIPKHAKDNNNTNNNSNALWLGHRHGLPRETWQRILFYVLHAATENSDATQEVLHVLSEDSPEELRIFDELVREALPIRVAAAHLLCISTTNTTRSEKSIKVLLPTAMQVLSKPILDNTSIHLVQTVDEMHARLEWCGFCKENLPAEVGGALELQAFLANWIENGHLAKSLHHRETNHASSSSKAPTDKAVGGSLGRSTAKRSDDEKDWHTELVESNVTVSRNSRCSLDEAIELMPEEDKQAYCEALSRVPDLVEKESKPSWYLQHDKHNSWDASSRLVNYWKKRKVIFGNRAFLPMNMTGEGALSKEGVAYFSTGALVFLPDDEDGRSVLCFDSSRTQGVKPGALLEVVFYAALICAQNRRSPVEGVVLFVATSNTSSHMKDELGKMLDIVSVFPFTWYSIHVISKTPEKTFLSNPCAFWEPSVLSSDRFCDKVIVHKVNSNEDIVSKLSAHGIFKAGIPQSCGGDWSYLQHARWQEQQIRIEWDLPLTGAGFGCNGFASNVKRRCELNENERTERKRRFNVLHSRRKRERDKVEREVLKKQADDLKRSNMKIMLDNQRIEGLIRAAEAEVKIAERACLQNQLVPPSCYGFSQASSFDARVVPPKLERSFVHQGPMISPPSRWSFPIQTHINPGDLGVFCNEQYPTDGFVPNQNAYGLRDSVVCGGSRGFPGVPSNPILHACAPVAHGARAPTATPVAAEHDLSWKHPLLSTAALLPTNDASSMALVNSGGMVPPQPQQCGDSQLDELSRRIAAMSNGFAPMYYNPYSQPR